MHCKIKSVSEFAFTSLEFSTASKASLFDAPKISLSISIFHSFPLCASKGFRHKFLLSIFEDI